MGKWTTKPLIMAAAVVSGAMLSGCAAAGRLTPAAIVEEQVHAYNAKDLEGFVGLYTKDAVIHNLVTGEVVGAGEDYMRERYTFRFTTSPDLHATILQRITIGKFVVDHEEVVMSKGEPPSQAVAIYHIDDDLIDAVWFIFDDDIRVVGPPSPQEVLDRHIQALRKRDVEAVLATFADDVVILELPSGELVRQGRDAMKARLEDSFLRRPWIEIEVPEQIVFGNYAASYERQRFSPAEPYEEHVYIVEISDGRIKRSWVLRKGQD